MRPWTATWRPPRRPPTPSCWPSGTATAARASTHLAPVVQPGAPREAQLQSMVGEVGRLASLFHSDVKLFHRARSEPEVWSLLEPNDLTGNPAAASCGPGRLDVVAVRADDRSIWHAGWEDGFDWPVTSSRPGEVRNGPGSRVLRHGRSASCRLRFGPAVSDAGAARVENSVAIGGHLPSSSPAATPAPGAIHLSAAFDSPGRSGVGA